MLKQKLIFLFGLVLLLSCRDNNNSGEISSGQIDYKITYLNNNLDDKKMELLPKHMRLMFNDKFAANFIEGFLGFYKLNTITYFHSRRCSTMLKVFDKQYLYKGRRGELMCCFDGMDDMKINETGETKVISGLLCKKAIITLPSVSDSFVIYYTNDIHLHHPNATNPYKKIDGVLMEFELRMLYLRMRFTAEKFQKLTNDDSIPGIPENIREVDRDQMTEILNKLME